jgi:hypothetical protein
MEAAARAKALERLDPSVIEGLDGRGVGRID